MGRGKSFVQNIAIKKGHSGGKLDDSSGVDDDHEMRGYPEAREMQE